MEKIKVCLHGDGDYVWEGFATKEQIAFLRRVLIEGKAERFAPVCYVQTEEPPKKKEPSPWLETVETTRAYR